MEDNFENVPQEQDVPQDVQQSAPQDVQQNVQQSAPQETQQNLYQQNQQNQQNAGYQYSYGNNQQYQSYNYESGNTQNYANQEDTSVMSMGDWLITILAFLIPCAGIILYFVWAFGKNGNANRRNYCRAYLICWAIEAVLATILVVVLVGAVASSGYYYYY